MSHSYSRIGLILLSKVGGILATLIFLPEYQRLLGDKLFGLVAIILSVQAFALVVDFGFSTLVNRAASVKSKAEGHHYWSSVQKLLFFLYVLILFIVIIISHYLSWNYKITVPVVLLIYLLVSHNVSSFYLLGKEEITLSSLSLLASAFFRSIGGVIGILYFSGVEGFIFGQLIATFFVWLWVNIKIYQQVAVKIQYKSEYINILGHSKVLMFVGVAGAAVLQFDKFIIGYFISLETVSAYFLAMTLCSVPLAIFGTPIFQYFQPLITKAYHSRDIRKVVTLSKLFNYCLVCIFMGCIIGYHLFSEWFIFVWLGSTETAVQVKEYSDLMIYAYLVAMFGYWGFMLMNAYEDYRFQSIMSISLSVIVISLVVYFSINQEVWSIIYLYITYHSLSMLIGNIRGINIVKKLKG